ncbi:MAG: ribosome small subunit-dependent GTPase A [Proteobacteria bacterium]|nr:ribosome small subunit-dependent GTPase A [Pseudomonadota bacterium]MBU1583175.1 ribosome small subunit-dependent GTPase A [Pseudomonadota bacterium]MBU2456081.1 ribosome small subunit-dependent GTPase A [Pseudomonadota bacterium]MBU2628850.1 ribosome small subunit-dependent GTPase A [Pseudomonadota bacterium]
MMINKKHVNNTNINEILQPLIKMGWDSHFQTHLDNICNEKVFPARVVGVRKNSFLISQGNSESLATAAGKLNHQKKNLFPVTGDWVLVNDKVISAVLPRKNSLSRGAAGTHGKQGSQPNKAQIIAANLDTVFIVCGLDQDYNMRRLERYLTLVYNCGLTPAIILTKADLHQNPEHYVCEVETVAFEVPVHCISAKDSIGLAPLELYLSKGRTIVMVGSSGSGKSTLVNRLSGKTMQATNRVSASGGKGKHTTTCRSLIMMPQGGMVIDNPGIREIGFWDDGGGLNVAFPEIENLATTCRFHDCSHTCEPGCQVLHGVTTGAIRKDRLDSHHKMRRELAYLSDRQTKSAGRVEKERWKAVSLKIKAINNRKTKQA